MGDISPEELRWANMMSIRNGTTIHSFKNELDGMKRARVEQFQALTRASKPPSLGGHPISRRPGTIANLYWMQETSRQGSDMAQFSQPSTFGGVSFEPTQQTVPEQQNRPFPVQNVNFGAPQPTLPLSGGFGGPFGASTSVGQPVFGQQQNFFGMNTQQPNVLNDTQMDNQIHGQPWGNGQSQHALGSNAMWNTGQTADAAYHGSMLGSSQADASRAPLAPSPQSLSGAPGSLAVTEQPQPNAAGEDRDIEAWKAPTFQRGKIPEHAPPPAVC